jgi:hypothetical protein
VYKVVRFLLLQSAYVYHISYEIFKRKIHTNSSYYSKQKVGNKRLGSLWKLSEFYTTEFVESYFYLCGHGYYHDRIDVDALAASTADVDEDPMALYLRYYDWSFLL